ACPSAGRARAAQLPLATQAARSSAPGPRLLRQAPEEVGRARPQPLLQRCHQLARRDGFVVVHDPLELATVLLHVQEQPDRVQPSGRLFSRKRIPGTWLPGFCRGGSRFFVVGTLSAAWLQLLRRNTIARAPVRPRARPCKGGPLMPPTVASMQR